MSSDVRWKYKDGRLKEKITTKTYSGGNRTVIRQKAHNTLFGRAATSIISRTRYVK